MPHLKILLADDDVDHQRLICHSLRSVRPDATITVVLNRDELLERVRGEPYDCILLDYNMPPHRATDILRDIDGLQESAPRIVLSASEDQRIVIDSIRCGVSDFFQKHEALDGVALWKSIDSCVEAVRAEQLERRRTNRRLKKLEQQAQTDPLTGLANRRFVERYMDGETRRGDRREHLSVILLDIDHFKNVNDTLGHCEGDRVLRRVAAVLASRARPSDVVGRWGGEEFIVLRQGASLSEAWIWADDLRRAIETEVIADEPIGHITASIGVDVLERDSMCADTVLRADRAMYLAKESGRNRVCTWDMAAAMEVANDVQSDPRLTPRERVLSVISRLDPSLGDVQRDHIGQHGLQVRALATAVAREITEDKRVLERLALAAEFHDLGKVGLPEVLLALPRSLSAGERRFIDCHATFGAELLSACGADEDVVNAVLRHHEWYNRRPADEFDGEVKDHHILSVCDAAIAMMTERPYAPSQTLPEILLELGRARGTQFHPKVVDCIGTMNGELRLAA